MAVCLTASDLQTQNIVEFLITYRLDKGYGHIHESLTV